MIGDFEYFKDGWTVEEVEAAIQRDDPDELLYVLINITMHPVDCKWSEQICVKLSSHLHFNVRGDAVLGFGHLARTCGALDESIVKPIIKAALQDEDEYVRGQADSAMDDTQHFLGWEY